MKAGRSWIETDVPAHNAAREGVSRTFGVLMEELAPAKLIEQ